MPIAKDSNISTTRMHDNSNSACYTANIMTDAATVVSARQLWLEHAGV